MASGENSRSADTRIPLTAQPPIPPEVLIRLSFLTHAVGTILPGQHLHLLDKRTFTAHLDRESCVSSVRAAQGKPLPSSNKALSKS